MTKLFDLSAPPVWATGGALIVSLALLAGCGAPAEESTPEPTVAVQVSLSTTRDVELFVSAPATLFPLEQATLASRGTGPSRTSGCKRATTSRKVRSSLS